MASLSKIIDVHSHIITNLGDSQAPTDKLPPWRSSSLCHSWMRMESPHQSYTLPDSPSRDGPGGLPTREANQ